MKKNLLFVPLLLLAKLCLSQIPQVSIKDSIFILVTDKIIDSAKVSSGDRRVITFHMKDLTANEVSREVPDKKFGTITESRDSLSYRLMVNVDLNQNYFDYHRPDFYFLRKGFLIFVYLGGEKFTLHDKRSKQQMQKLLKSQSKVYALAQFFLIDVKGDNFEFISNR
jgi:hypothetical protein